MAKKAVINFRVEENLKAEMERTCRGMGINMTTALDLFCRKVVAERRIPFEIESGVGGWQRFSTFTVGNKL
jgi:addiction module RelB/DinJ family antitoxin